MGRNKLKGTPYERGMALVEAMYEAATHLELTWTDDEIEIQEGKRYANRLYRQAEKLQHKIISKYRTKKVESEKS